MTDTVWDLEIKMLIPFDAMIFYPDDYKDEYIVEPSFQKILDALNIEINISEIIEDLYTNRGMNPSVSVYFSDNTYKNFILIDVDIEPSDQLDLIIVCIRCIAEKGGIIRQYAHEFYTKRCKYNVIYAEGNFEIRDKYKTDFSLFNISSKIDYEKIKNKGINFYQAGYLLKSV